MLSQAGDDRGRFRTNGDDNSRRDSRSRAEGHQLHAPRPTIVARRSGVGTGRGTESIFRNIAVGEVSRSKTGARRGDRVIRNAGAENQIIGAGCGGCSAIQCSGRSDGRQRDINWSRWIYARVFVNVEHTERGYRGSERGCNRVRASGDTGCVENLRAESTAPGQWRANVDERIAGRIA